MKVERQDQPPTQPPGSAPLVGPTREQWLALPPAGQEQFMRAVLLDYEAREIAALATMAEGEPHQEACDTIRDTLRTFLRQRGSALYVAAGIPVIYPQLEPFSPDILAVTNVPLSAQHPRERWHVLEEGRTLDLALEIYHHGSWRKDFVDNVKKYALLGIREYFAFDMNRQVLQGFRLAAGGERYDRLRPVQGRLHSQVLDLDLVVQDRRILFFFGTARLLSLSEQIAQERERAEQERERAEQERERAEQEREQRERAEQERERALAARASDLLKVLQLRQVPLDEAPVQRILACRDAATLDAWFSLALGATPQDILGAR